ncbi:MAG TPA: SEC-C metal-binding domain-containing protein [Haliangium sp.]|nr:SEC-C metal-binding domain-containing protein [Haliangium sp.]
MAREDLVVTLAAVDDTVASFSEIDNAGNTRAMNKMARRLGKEQPALLRYAAALREQHGERVGEAAVFYGTLVWAMFDRHAGRKLPTLTPENLADAEKVLDEALAKVEDLDARPVYERHAEPLMVAQPHIYAKLAQLLEEDVRGEVIDEECVRLILRPTQAAIEAFDAALDGRRPGERRGPLVRDAPKVGRNDPCPCGSGQKYKRCHGA